MTSRILTRERRREERTACGDLVMIHHEDGSTYGSVLRGRITNVSPTGLGIRLPGRIESRTYVAFRIDRQDRSGMASVRHCTRSKMDYLIGLEFTGALNRPR